MDDWAYTAKFVATYGKANNLPLVATMTFWVFPWKVALIIILLIVVAVLSLYAHEKKRPNAKSETPVQPRHSTPTVAPKPQRTSTTKPQSPTK